MRSQRKWNKTCAVPDASVQGYSGSMVYGYSKQHASYELYPNAWNILKAAEMMILLDLFCTMNKNCERMVRGIIIFMDDESVYKKMHSIHQKVSVHALDASTSNFRRIADVIDALTASMQIEHAKWH